MLNSTLHVNDALSFSVDIQNIVSTSNLCNTHYHLADKLQIYQAICDPGFGHPCATNPPHPQMSHFTTAIHAKNRSVSSPSLPRKQGSVEFRRRNNLIDEGCMLFQCDCFMVFNTFYLCNRLGKEKWVLQRGRSLAKLSCSCGAAPAPQPSTTHTSPCQRYPSVSGMPRVWSGNQTRLLRIDTLPPWLPPPCIFSNLTPTGQGLEAGNWAGQ